MRQVNKGATPQHFTLRQDAHQQDFNADDYKLYAGFLMARIGEYCSYCEIPLGADLAVEHKKPKSQYIDLETEWPNFLLACRNCNSVKGKRDTIPTVGAGWPDTDDTFAMFQYAPDANGNVLVLRSATGGAAADALIDLTKLNKLTADDEVVADRRVANRTATWAIATNQAQLLVNMMNAMGAAGMTLAAVLADDSLRLLCRRISDCAAAAGFWSVWITQFSAALRTIAAISAAQRTEIMTTMFGSDVFPGTVFPAV